MKIKNPLLRAPIRATLIGSPSCSTTLICLVLARFGFILTNKEIVLAQFLREDESSPRRQRGLRSLTLPEHLHQGLPSDFESSDTRGSDDRGGHGGKPLWTPQPRQKRRHESGDSATLARSHPPNTNNPAGREGDEPPSSPPIALLPPSNLRWSSPRSTLEARLGAESRARGSPANRSSPSPSGLPPSLSHLTTSPEQHPLQSSPLYNPSIRDLDIGRVLVRSFRIPNPCDEESTDREEEDRIHPAKALFALLMHAYSVGREGRTITEEETEF